MRLIRLVAAGRIYRARGGAAAVGMEITMRHAAALIIFGVIMSQTTEKSDAADPPSPVPADLTALVGQPVDIAPSAYLYRADRKAEENPPEAWLLLVQWAGLPYDKPVDVNAPAVKKALCGLLWEEVRPVRRVELTWPAGARPLPQEVALAWFDASDSNAHTWWNPRTVKDAGQPQASSDGLTYVYTIPGDTWGVVASVRGDKEASALAVPAVRALVPQVWKKMDLAVEWGFEDSTAPLQYDGRIEAYDGLIGDVRPMPGDAGTSMTGPHAWRSARGGDAPRGVQVSMLYMGASRWRRVWPYDAQPEDVPRTILTVWTKSGSLSLLVSDLEMGPILAPEYGFFARAASKAAAGAQAQPANLLEQAKTAKEFLKELAAKNLSTIRQRVRKHPEQTWEGAVGAMHAGQALPPHPKPPFEPAMQVQVPCERLTAQWKLGAWHILRRSVRDEKGTWRFNDFPFGILASETYMILRTLDLQGMHKEAADGLDQWLSLPMEPKVVPGSGGHHGWARPDRPLGLFSDGKGCLTHASGVEGAGGHMDGVHAMGPGAIMFTLIEHFRLTGDLEWLKANAPRMKANARWILRQRQLLASNLPGGERLWSKGLQPAHVVTPDSACMHMQFYETEAYYWLAVKRMAELLALVDPDDGARMAAEAEAYRQDLLAAIGRSIALTPVVPVRDGTYRSFIPFAPYVRGFAAGAWGWRRCQGHVGAIYWDTVQSADPLISPSGILSPRDVRVQGHLDVLEDRLLLENTKVHSRTAGYDPEKHWFAHASWQYQCGLERHANIHLAADDIPNFIRSVLNQYAVDIMPGEYTFREHTTGGPPDKIYEESCFLERFRHMLVMEEGDLLWLARATPRAWLEQGKKIAVTGAPTHFGTVDYQIVSDAANGRITATVRLPSRNAPKAVLLRLRHPTAAPIQDVTVNGQAWKDFSLQDETIRLAGLSGAVTVVARYPPGR
jgi:hypothetical protein